MKKNREYSSQSSGKTKSKTQKTTPAQQFNVGDLVFLRDGKTKNSPREVHIVEDTQDQFYLIRKFNTKLRQKLYQVLPDELIRVPTTYPPESPVYDYQSTPQEAVSEIPSYTPKESLSEEHTPQPALTPAGRPLRQAARKAFAIPPSIAACTVSKKKQSIFKSSWLPEDQYDDDFDYTPIAFNPSTRANSISSTCSNTNSEALASSSDQDLSWDNIPEQYSLTPSPIQACQSAPHSPLPPTLPPPSRRHAISDSSLCRSQAFRHPPDNIPPMPIIQTRHFYNSRIPRPSSTSQVVLDQVNDISDLPVPDIERYNLRNTRARNERLASVDDAGRTRQRRKQDK